MYFSRLETVYKKKISLTYMRKFNIKNIMQVPKILFICINMGLGDSVDNNSIIKKNINCLEKICGQKVMITKAKKSISAFKIRKDMQIGLKSTLRKNCMWEFLDKFINIALPRVKDFQGLYSKFDNSGNITIGIKDNIIFPDINYKNIDKIRGMNITISMSSNNNKKSKFLLQQLGLPIF